ncbi:MAG: lysophospholipid acyltransferase family protein [Patescibacteria group bacterium]
MEKTYPIFRRTLGAAFMWRPDEVVGYDNIPAKGPFIVAVNHISHLEPFMVGAQVVKKTDQKVHYIAKPEYWKWPGAKLAAQYSGAVVYDKKDKKGCLDPALNVLKTGGIMAIFPEGTRNFDYALLRGHTGVARMVLGAKVPVLPVGFFGPHTYGWDTFIHLFFKGTKIKIIFGQLMHFDQHYEKKVTKKLLQEITDEVMRAIGKLCQKSYPYKVDVYK